MRIAKHVRSLLVGLGFVVALFLGGSQVTTVWAATSTYDFSICYPNCLTDPVWFAASDVVNVFPFGGNTANRVSHNEFEGWGYATLIASDDGWYLTDEAGSTQDAMVWLEMPIEENPASVSQLDFLFEGYPENWFGTYSIWVKTADGAYQDNSSWTKVSDEVGWWPGEDGILTGSLTTNVSDYISNDGLVVWVIYQDSTTNNAINPDYVKIDVTYSSVAVDQEGFRFRADDGSESAASWLAAQDTAITRGTNTTTRLRMLLNNTTAENDAGQYRLEYKKSTDSTFQPVPAAGSSEPITLAASDYISASGQSTTVQLTAPSTKTTGDFVTGRIQDDENPADSVTINGQKYTEMEWSLTATAFATADDIYQFRVTKNGQALASYSVTPEWTIDSPPVISISLTTDGVVEYGTLGVEESKSTLDLSDTQTVLNDGDTTIDVNIKTSAATGGTGWTLGSSPGSNIFVHEFSTNSGSNWTAFGVADVYQTLTSGLTASASQNFDLQLTTPNPATDAVEKSITITIQAVAQ